MWIRLRDIEKLYEKLESVEQKMINKYNKVFSKSKFNYYEFQPPIIIVGQTNSGKSTLLKELQKLGVYNILTYTTRPMREGETDGVDYRFVTHSEFEALIERNFFLEYITKYPNFEAQYYGTAIGTFRDYDRQTAIVVCPDGLQSIMEYYRKDKFCKKPFIVYLDVPAHELLTRGLKRKDNLSELKRRLEADKHQFSHMERTVKFDMRVKKWKDITKLAKKILLKVNKR